MSFAKMNKFNAKKVVTDAGTFDSQKEYRRYLMLKELESYGAISNLHRQVEFELIPPQYAPSTLIEKGKHKGELKPGRLLERKCSYIADFTYMEKGEFVVEDVKGFKHLPEYVIKRKLMLWLKGIAIKEM